MTATGNESVSLAQLKTVIENVSNSDCFAKRGTISDLTNSEYIHQPGLYGVTSSATGTPTDWEAEKEGTLVVLPSEDATGFQNILIQNNSEFAWHRYSLSTDGNTSWVNFGTITRIVSTSPIAGSGTYGTITLSHASSGVTAGSYGASADASPGNGGTFSVPQVTVDATGHVTSAATRTITLPSSVLAVNATSPIIATTSSTSGGVSVTHATSGVTAASYGPSANSSPGSAGTFTVPQITVNAYGHVTSASSRTITMPTVSSSTVYKTAYLTRGGTAAGTINLTAGTNTAIDMNSVVGEYDPDNILTSASTYIRVTNADVEFIEISGSARFQGLATAAGALFITAGTSTSIASNTQYANVLVDAGSQGLANGCIPTFRMAPLSGTYTYIGLCARTSQSGVQIYNASTNPKDVWLSVAVYYS